MVKQINQKPISAKVDIDIYASMLLYCKRSGTKRNRLINIALSDYLAKQDF